MLLRTCCDFPRRARPSCAITTSSTRCTRGARNPTIRRMPDDFLSRTTAQAGRSTALRGWARRWPPRSSSRCSAAARSAGRDAARRVLGRRRALSSASVRSLLDLDSDDGCSGTSLTGPFLSYARDRLERLAHSANGQSEWDLDVWHIARLPGVKRRGCTRRAVLRVLPLAVVAIAVQAVAAVAARTGISASDRGVEPSQAPAPRRLCELRGTVLAGPQDSPGSCWKGSSCTSRRSGSSRAPTGRSARYARSWMTAAGTTGCPGLIRRRPTTGRITPGSGAAAALHLGACYGAAEQEENLDRLPAPRVAPSCRSSSARAFGREDTWSSRSTRSPATLPALPTYATSTTSSPASDSSRSATSSRTRCANSRRTCATTSPGLPLPAAARPRPTPTVHTISTTARCGPAKRGNRPAISARRMARRRTSPHTVQHTLATRMINHDIPKSRCSKCSTTARR